MLERIDHDVANKHRSIPKAFLGEMAHRHLRRCQE